MRECWSLHWKPLLPVPFEESPYPSFAQRDSTIVEAVDPHSQTVDSVPPCRQGLPSAFLAAAAHEAAMHVQWEVKQLHLT